MMHLTAHEDRKQAQLLSPVDDVATALSPLGKGRSSA